MSSSLRHILISLAIVGLAVLAHGRLLQAGWLGDDLRLVRASSTPAAASEPRAWLFAGEVRPAPTLVLRAAADALRTTALDDHARALTLRATALVLLLLGALLAGLALRRALTPWVGGDTARAAGFACALFFAVHPLAGSAVARPRALGDLLVWVFGALAAFLFLRGRQMREKRWVVAAGIAALLAGAAAPSAWLLPFVLAGLEFGSARRPRPLAERLRTAVTTFVIFAACVFVESVVAAALGLSQRTPVAASLPNLSVWRTPGIAITACVEKLGLLFFPVTGGSLSANFPSYLVCIAIVLIAMWPALRSARAAPRSWGSLATAWIAIMLLALVAQAGEHVTPDDGSRADVLLFAAGFAAAGLAVAATSLLGTRRIVLPALIAIGSSWLSARAAGDYCAATDVVTRLRAAIVAAQREVDAGGMVLVVDPPRRVIGRDLGLEPLAQILVEEPAPGESPLAVTAEAIPFLSRTAQFAQWRAHKVAFLERESGAAVADTLPSRVRVIAPTAGTKRPAAWLGESRSKIFDLDPASVHFARVKALPLTSSADAPRMAWRASEPAGERVIATGVWIEEENSLVALFDPWRDPAWWTAPTIRRVWAEDPLLNVASFELLEDLPLVIEGGAPQIDGPDWTFEVKDADLAHPLRGSATFTLELLDMEDLEYASFACTESVAGGVRSVRAHGAAGFVASRFAAGSGTVAWSLERRVGDVVVARASGDRGP